MKLYTTLIADLHVGAVPNNRLIKEVEEVYIYNMEQMEQLDVIFILGDFFDMKAYANDTLIDTAMLIMRKITTVAKKKGSKIRIVYGTDSHDADQYKLFRIYESDEELDFKVIKTCSDEELFPNFKVLYIPEEYILNKDSYYKEYFDEDNKYDLVLGHGVIKEVMGEATRNIEKAKTDTNRLKVPTFTSYELSRICKGKVFFGHYHENTVIQDKVYYVGSYSRWQFGEDTKKGYYELKVKDGNFKEKFIINYLARNYQTFYYGYDSEIFFSEKKFIEELKRLDFCIKAGFYDFIRLNMNIPENFENPNLIMDILKTRYKDDNRIKLLVTNGIAEKAKRLHNEKVDEVISKYQMIFDKNIKLEEKVKYFIKNKYDRDINIEDIKKYLYSDLQVILQGDDEYEEETTGNNKH